MKPFLGDDFFLESDTAKLLYHQYAKNMPIFDYHCHLTAKEIFENQALTNITDLWLGDDHYKWRVLRANGVPEEYITGDKSDYEKFIKWAGTVPELAGNPLYHWTHLELQRCFNIYDELNEETASFIWEECNAVIQKGSFSAKNIMEQFKVEALCTTDDPTDSLVYHQKLIEDSSLKTKVLPTFRPDGALNIHLHSFKSWVNKLELVSEIKIDSFNSFLTALKNRVEFFHDVGCRLSDHGLDSPFYLETNKEECEKIFQKAIRNDDLLETEITKFRTYTLVYLGKQYAEKGWAMQFHIGGLRNTNTRMVEKVGPNTGFDSIADFNYSEDLAQILDALEKEEKLPKTILYNLNPKDNYMLATMAGNFQGQIPGKIQFGTAWWFNDQRDGMESQIKTLANVGVLSRFIGMLTDSRSLLSYTRHEYFRRILCNILGNWVEKGEIAPNIERLGSMVQDISYNNINQYIKTD